MAVELGNSATLAVTHAERARTELGHRHLGVEHLFLGVVALDDRSLHLRCGAAGVDIDEAARRVREAARQEGPPGESDVGMTPRAKRVMEAAMELALTVRPEGNTDEVVWAPHILLAILAEENGLPVRTLRGMGADPAAVAQAVRDMIAAYEWTESAYRGRTPVEQPELASSSDLMETLGRDLTELAKQGKLRPVIGRQMELLQIISVLCKSEKNNPVLVGEAGVGKTAIVEGLAQLLARGTVPPQLQGKRIRTVEVANIVAGTGVRGQLEEKLQALIKEARDDSSLILFIDEIHMLVGAGATGLHDTMDAANILKPALSRGEITVIGATTYDEYRKNIEKDPALERRFAMVRVPEPTADDTLEILAGLRARYEEFHNVSISDDALRAAVQLAIRYVTDRRLPDKALELIDRSCAESRMREWLGLGDLDLSDLSPEQRRTLFERTAETSPGAKLTIGPDEVALAVSSWRRIPVGKVKATEAERLLDLEGILRRRVLGQDHAVAAVAQSIRTARTAFGDPMRPIGCFLFLGPTGVGKTELAKSLAEALFDDESRLIRVDMSESYSEHFISRLIGSPPGYVNSEMGGMLTEAIRRDPYSVVLFDELEKADTAVHELLLGLMDEGRLTDGLGRAADFRNAVIVMTSNVGSRNIGKRRFVGFRVDLKEKLTADEVKAAVAEDLTRTFAPEFRNRFDEIIVFNPLGDADLARIASLMLARLPMRVEADAKALAFLVKHGYDETMGARPLRRAIQDLVAEPLSNELLKGALGEHDVVRLGVKRDKLTFTVLPANGPGDTGAEPPAKVPRPAAEPSAPAAEGAP
jgi:ATP-dependent Clp protease ATP-binding subunit ClpC